MARKVVFIGTGGTIASIGKGPLDLIDYGADNTMVHAEDIVTVIPSVREVADLCSPSP
jgi:L-asparaginase